MIRPLLAASALAILSSAAAAQDKPSAAPPAAHDAQPGDVVVTGVRLSDSAAALKACLDRKCPPDQDIAATLAHAENLFVAGDYHAARQTLGSSIGRNKRHAAKFPVQVSDLLRANSRIAAHLGDGESYQIGAFDVLSALKAGLPDNDPRVLAARIEVGDSFAKTRQPDMALNIYKEVAQRAHQLHLPVVEGYARLRTAIFLRAMADSDAGTYRRDAVKAIDALIQNPDPQLAAFALAGKLLKAQMAAKDGDTTAIDALVAEYRGKNQGTRPVLLYGPKIQSREQSNRQFNGGSTTNQLAADNFDNQWVDVSFWITPDGRVSDAGVLRESPKLSGYWVKPIVDSIAGRRYAPLAMDPSQPGLLRVERYTFTSRWTTVVGSHLPQREPTPQIEMIDLSQDAPTKG
ncbi:MAG: hypothetical protein V4475_15555 [Pseudomonadota bacterium]